MTGIFNDFLALIKELLVSWGLENETIQYIVGLLSLVFLSILAIVSFANLIKKGFSIYFNRKAIKDLHPFYSRAEVEYATKYYIETRFQNVPPSQDEEPGRNYVAAARDLLIPLFLKKAFNNDADDNKYYLVLADSGMGKTTFMINLYIRYKSKLSWPWKKPKYKIKLFPMGHPKTFDTIKEMSSDEKQNTILLLDAFDEDNAAVQNYKKRLDEVLEVVWEFREIVMTCRTQFFPSSKNEPMETGRFKHGTKGGEYKFQKVYVSVFSNDDIKKYLNKRFRSFPFFNTKEYYKALAIVTKSPNLMMRPMLLSHVHDLIAANFENDYSFQIYETLIEQWIERESNKAGIGKKYGKEEYKKLLYDFSRALARNLYLKREERDNKLSIGIDEIINNSGGLQLKDIEGNKIGIDQHDQSSRSLLNRNAIGEYKFSHKSILEYFLAYEALNNLEFRKQFFFDPDLDTAKKFFLETIKVRIENSEINKIYTNKIFFPCKLIYRLCSHEINFHKTDLSEIGLAKIGLAKIDLDGIDLDGTDFNIIPLSEIDLNEIDLNEIHSKRIDLNGIDLKRIGLNRIFLKRIFLDETNLNLVDLDKINLNEINSNEVNLNRIRFSLIYLDKVNLNEVNLNEVNLNEVNLNRIDLDEIDLDEIDPMKSYIYKIFLSESILYEGRLIGMHLSVYCINFSFLKKLIKLLKIRKLFINYKSIGIYENNFLNLIKN